MCEIVVTEPVVIPVKPTEKGLLAFASCTLNNALSLNSIAIYSRPNGNGYRLVYPIRKLINGKEIAIFYPISRETAKIIDNAIIGKFEEITRGCEEITNVRKG